MAAALACGSRAYLYLPYRVASGGSRGADAALQRGLWLQKENAVAGAPTLGRLSMTARASAFSSAAGYSTVPASLASSGASGAGRPAGDAAAAVNAAAAAGGTPAVQLGSAEAPAAAQPTAATRRQAAPAAAPPVAATAPPQVERMSRDAATGPAATTAASAGALDDILDDAGAAEDVGGSGTAGSSADGASTAAAAPTGFVGASEGSLLSTAIFDPFPVAGCAGMSSRGRAPLDAESSISGRGDGDGGGGLHASKLGRLLSRQHSMISRWGGPGSELVSSAGRVEAPGGSGTPGFPHAPVKPGLHRASADGPRSAPHGGSAEPAAGTRSLSRAASTGGAPGGNLTLRRSASESSPQLRHLGCVTHWAEGSCRFCRSGGGAEDGAPFEWGSSADEFTQGCWCNASMSAPEPF